MPESEFPAMIDDLRDFWTWVDKDLEGILEEDIDASNVAIVGESAGGYLTAQSVQLGLTTKAAVIMMQYPCLAIKEHLEERQRDPADKQIPESIIDDYLAKVKPGAVLSRAPFSTRMDLAIAAMQANRGWALDTHPELDPMVSLETAPRMPPVFLFHAIDDTYVSLNRSLHWMEKLKQVQPEAVLYAVFPPGDHVLDKYHGLDEQWLKGPIAFVEEYWPVKRT
jgi:acetyl esterase/lipase